mmetsp:Transcript_13759/g.25792  ORF Transcript_13759/g.25792 Transcript_13759/m.25792 type:complete len:122 (-) Transcript_13759:131-496(-)
MSEGESPSLAGAGSGNSTTSTPAASSTRPSSVTFTSPSLTQVELLQPPSEEGDSPPPIGDDLFLSWGGFAALASVLLAGGIWRLRRRRRVPPREPQVFGRLLDEVEEQELVPATANGYGIA